MNWPGGLLYTGHYDEGNLHFVTGHPGVSTGVGVRASTIVIEKLAALASEEDDIADPRAEPLVEVAAKPVGRYCVLRRNRDSVGEY